MGRGGKHPEEIGFEEGNAVGEAKAGGVAMGYTNGGSGNVCGEDLRGGEFFGQGDGDAAGACADVNDGKIFSGEFGRAASAEFTDGEAVESDFDEVLGFGAGNENVRGDFEIEAPEFLMAREVLRGLAGSAAAD